LDTLRADAQSSGFRYGGHLGLGESHFNRLSGVSVYNKLGFNFGVTASKQFTRYFSLEANALFTSKGAKTSGTIIDGNDMWGNPQSYSFTEVYNLFYAELPVMARMSAGFDNFFLSAYGGASANINLFAAQTRTYDDYDYDMANGYMTAPMKDVEVVELSAVYGLRVSVEANENVFYVDFRFSNAQTPFGKIPSSSSDAFNSYFNIGIGVLYK
jgi:hypothetical protein